MCINYGFTTLLLSNGIIMKLVVQEWCSNTIYAVNLRSFHSGHIKNTKSKMGWNTCIKMIVMHIAIDRDKTKKNTNRKLNWVWENKVTLISASEYGAFLNLRSIRKLNLIANQEEQLTSFTDSMQSCTGL
jgi:hypothetical protein